MAQLRSIRVSVLLLGDLFLSWLLFSLVFSLRNSYVFSYFSKTQDLIFYVPYILGGSISMAVVFGLFYLYDRGRSLVSLSYLTDYVRAVFVWGLVLVALPFFAKIDYSRAIVILYFILSVGILLSWRIILTYLWPSGVSHDEDEVILKSAHELMRFSENYPNDLDLIEGLPRKRTSWATYSFLKRIFDLLLSLILFVILLPLMLVIIFIIRWNSDGRAIIRQDRVGWKGQEFKMYKFRTMNIDTPLYAPAPREGDDPRLTRIGRSLRRLGLDEIPQLLNVIRGEMSLVGPRPEMPFVVSSYKEWQRRRLVARPGITGLWQILGRREVPMAENLEYDFYYLTHRSFLLDLVILLKTVPVVLFGKGTY